MPESPRYQFIPGKVNI
jgi:hypothetical protein